MEAESDLRRARLDQFADPLGQNLPTLAHAHAGQPHDEIVIRLLQPDVTVMDDAYAERIGGLELGRLDPARLGNPLVVHGRIPPLVLPVGGDGVRRGAHHEVGLAEHAAQLPIGCRRPFDRTAAGPPWVTLRRARVGPLHDRVDLVVGE